LPQEASSAGFFLDFLVFFLAVFFLVVFLVEVVAFFSTFSAAGFSGVTVGVSWAGGVAGGVGVVAFSSFCAKAAPVRLKAKSPAVAHVTNFFILAILPTKIYDKGVLVAVQGFEPRTLRI
jgi:hypothetical protein